MLDCYTRLFVEQSGRPATYGERLELELYATGTAHMTETWLAQPNAPKPDVLARIFTNALPAFLRAVL